MVPVDVSPYLNLIEERLGRETALPQDDDVEIILHIAKSFYRVWELCHKYPELGSKVDDAMFRDIFKEMSSKFGRPDMKITFTCESCNVQFPLLNNDLEFTFQVHQKTSEHMTATAVMSDSGLPDSSSSVDGIVSNASTKSLESYSSTSGDTELTSAASSSGSKSPERSSHISKCNKVTRSTLKFAANVRADKWIRMRKDKKYCVLCDVKLENDVHLRHHIGGLRHREDNEWISRNGTKYSCDLCNVTSLFFGELKEHVDGLSHEIEIWNTLKYFNSISSKTLIDARITSIMDLIYDHQNPKVRLAYFFNKACIVRPRQSSRYMCGLCQIFMKNECQVFNHLLDEAHKTKLDEVISLCDARYVTFEVGIICGVTRNDRKCNLCDIRFHESNFFNYRKHMQSREHQKRMRAHFESPRFKKWEKGIILKNGYPFCIFCQLFLNDQRAMQIHVNDPVHRGRFESYERL